MSHILDQLTALRRVKILVSGVLLVALLAACSSSLQVSMPASSPAAVNTAAAPTQAPAATEAPTAAPATNTSSDSAIDAIKNVIQRANQEQQQAVAAQNPKLMQDTATTSYYTQATQGLGDLLNSGVTAIELVNIDWGPITLQGTSGAQATTTETWRTTLGDGSTLQEADTNVYTLVLESGSWKVQDDQHPDSQGLQPPQGTPGAAPAPAEPASAEDAGQSRNWSGYAATGGVFTAVSATWKVPTISASSASAADATWVGIGGVSSHDLIQAGTDASVQGGRVRYTAWVETLPQASQPVQLAVGAGDTVNVAITQQADGTWQVRIRNETTGKTYQKNITYQSSRSSAEWIEESPAVGRRTLLPLDNFGTVSFSSASTVEDGQQHTIAQAGGQAITMSEASGQALARPSKLGGDGTSFSVTRTNTPASSSLPGTRTRP